jgi:hypothetical protein
MSLSDYLRSWRHPLVFAAFAWDDPLPGVADLILTIYRRAVRRWRRPAGAGMTPVAEQRSSVAPADVWADAVALRRQIVGDAASPAEATTRLGKRLEAIKQSSIGAHGLRRAASDLSRK